MSISGIMFSRGAKKSDKQRDSTLSMPEDVTAIYDINYKGNNDEYNMLDIYYPKGTNDKLPVIVSFHGGGYVYGTKLVYKHYGAYMASKGFVFVNFNYHLAPKMHFPGQLSEANDVFAWMCANADEYFMDVNNVIIVGDSAGAQMASQYAAIVSNPEYAAFFPFKVPTGFTVRAIGLNCGMYNKPGTPDPEDKMAKFTMDLYSDYFGKHPEKRLSNFDKMTDPLKYVNGSYPPSFIMTSYYDFLQKNAEPMHKLLQSRGVESLCMLYGEEGQEHMGHVCHVNMNLEEAKKINDDEIEFFRKYLK